MVKDAEYREIKHLARSRHLSIVEWVRQALAEACRRESPGDVEKKLEAVRAAVRHNSGTAVDIDTMLAEIERGYAIAPSFDSVESGC